MTIRTLALAIFTCLTFAASNGHAETPEGWDGEWQTFWRSGQAVINLNQDGTSVTGTYQPGNGQIQGEIDERGVLRGTWEQPGARGGLLFALSDEGTAFSGRFDNGEYWNGRRSDGEGRRSTFTASFAPRETLRTYIAAANEAIFQGNAAAARIFEPLLVYEGGTEDARERNRRRELLWKVMNLSTFRVFDAPGTPEGNTATFSIGPAGGSAQYPLRFLKDDNGSWQLVVDREETLRAGLDSFLTDMGYRNYEEAQQAAENSPRGAMRQFLLGMKSWDSGGDKEALAALNLSYLPLRLRDIEGPILSDYLRHVLNRVGFVIWQEIPNDPKQVVPYLHYRHPFGTIAIEKVTEDNGESTRWAFSSTTLLTVPDVFAAIQKMPTANGLAETNSVTRFFQLRETIRGFSPVLLERGFVLENWQWAALVIAIVVSIVMAWLAAALLGGLASVIIDADDHRDEVRQSLAWPLRLAAGGTILFVLLANLGLLHSGFGYGGRLVALIAVIGVTALIFQLIGVIGRTFIRRAETTPGYVDDIVWSLATGLGKMVAVIFGIFVAADVIGLPYEGVITGLGVGGVALAFAARDTVSNMLSGAILMTDRPFKRGDLIAADGEMASVENVGLRSTRLRTLDDSLLVIPNSQLVDKAIVNWGRRRKRKVLLQIGLTYDTPREKFDTFCERLREVYMDQPRSDKTTCYIGLKSFGASSIDIELWGFFGVATYDAFVEAQHALVGDIIDLAREVEVSFAFPTRTIHIERDDEDSGLREQNLVPASRS